MRRSHSTRPPRPSRTATSASAICCDPPFASGHPTRWASTPSIRPYPAVTGAFRLEDRVAGEPGEQCPRLVGVEPSAGDRVGRQDADRAVASERDRVLRRDRERRQQPVGQVETGLDERAEQPAVGLGVGAETVGGVVHRAVQQRSATAVERVRHRHVGVDPFQTVRLQRRVARSDLAERRRAERERMDRRTHVVQHAGQRQLLGPGAAAGSGGGFEHRHVPPGPRQRDGRHQPVRTGADAPRRSGRSGSTSHSLRNTFAGWWRSPALIGTRPRERSEHDDAHQIPPAVTQLCTRQRERCLHPSIRPRRPRSRQGRWCHSRWGAGTPANTPVCHLASARTPSVPSRHDQIQTKHLIAAGTASALLLLTACGSDDNSSRQCRGLRRLDRRRQRRDQLPVHRRGRRRLGERSTRRYDRRRPRRHRRHDHRTQGRGAAPARGSRVRCVRRGRSSSTARPSPGPARTATSRPST